MPQSKITFFYHDNLGGFSESWIDNANSPKDVPILRLQNYIRTRMGISGNETRWDYIRLADTLPANARKVKVYTPTSPSFNALPKGGTFGGGGHVAPESADFSGTRFLVRKESENLEYARIFFAGFPDSMCKGGGLYSPSPVFENAFDAWTTTIVNNAWGWMSRTTNAANSPAALTNAVNDPNTGLLTITVGAALFTGLTKGTSVILRISRQRVPANINGTNTFNVINDTTAVSRRPLAISNFVESIGLVYRKTTTFIPLFQQVVERITKRGPGRPFGLYRGRSSIRVRG